MNIVNKKVSSLKGYKNNPRKISSLAVEMVANSISEFGIKQPLVIDKDNTIIVGHTRLKACKKLGIKEVPCLVADDLTQEQIDAYRLADNKTGEFSLWDETKLDTELFDISMNMEQFGFDLDLDEEEEGGGNTDEDDVPEPPVVPKSKLGEVYQLGKHRLMCGDSTSEKDVNLLMNGEKADMIFTDPPYGVDYEGINNDDRAGLTNLLDGAFSNYERTSKEGSSVYCFHSDKCADIFHLEFRKFFHFSSMLIWFKGFTLSQSDYQSCHEPCMYGWLKNGTHNYYGDRKQLTVWEIKKESIEGHTTPKPVEFITKAINNSCKKKGIVSDFFGGSGSTLIGAEQTNRTCYMMELDPIYIDVIIKRWEDYTGNKAELIREV